MVLEAGSEQVRDRYWARILKPSSARSGVCGQVGGKNRVEFGSDLCSFAPIFTLGIWRVLGDPGAKSAVWLIVFSHIRARGGEILAEKGYFGGVFGAGFGQA